MYKFMHTHTYMHTCIFLHVYICMYVYVYVREDNTEGRVPGYALGDVSSMPQPPVALTTVISPSDQDNNESVDSDESENHFYRERNFKEHIALFHPYREEGRGKQMVNIGCRNVWQTHNK